jgi:hypothetical protein
MNILEFKEKYPDLYNTIFEEGKKAGHTEGYAGGESAGIERGKAEGADIAAKAERERIQSVEAQLIPGHEKLIQEMKFDGKTTGEQAAVRILQAEKTLRENVLANLAADATLPVKHAPAPEGNETISALPEGQEKWKAEYEKAPEIQKEFKSLEIYTAYRQGVKDGRVKIFGREVK